MALVLRLPRSEDAEPLAAVHVRAWQVAYRGSMLDAYLDGRLTPAKLHRIRRGKPRVSGAASSRVATSVRAAD
jgi:hypothetical protein